MKIGIYGDSYTTFHGSHDQPTNWYTKLASLLSDNNSKVDVAHYGMGGSSLYYSYQKFHNTHRENDLNIVLITGPSRYPFSIQMETPNHIRVFTCKEHVMSTIDALADTLTNDELRKLNNVIAWFDACLDDRYFNDVGELMVDRISSTPNTIVYPCFSDSFTSEQFKKHNLNKHMHFMHSLWFRQCELLKIDPESFSAIEKKTLCGHLSMEFNVFFAQVLYKRIQTGKWDHTGLLDVTISQPRKFYYDNFKDE